MIEQKLILLGLLKESPKHGYEIKRQIKEILSIFAGIDFKSIYYPLSVLEKQGLVKKYSAKEGRRPLRFVYSLTPKGEKQFEELLQKSLLNFKRPRFSLDVSLYFLRYIKAPLAKRRLRARTVILNKLTKDLQQLIASYQKKHQPPLVNILEHNLRMVKTESEFLLGLLKTL